jgi:hypothetical protein
MDHATTARGTDDDRASALAESAAIVWRLALDAGLTPEQAGDVCVVTLQDAFPSGEVSTFADRRRRGWLLRTALEQCAIAKTLAAEREAPYPDEPHVVTQRGASS